MLVLVRRAKAMVRVMAWLGCAATACTGGGGSGDGDATGSGSSSGPTSGNDGVMDDGDGGTMSGATGVGTGADDDPTGADDADETGDPPEEVCDPFGYFGTPETSFVLPTREGTGIYYPDVQSSFPEVDWNDVDRLYIPAGQYLSLDLGNLPDRTPDDPLVITNMGGQVRIGPNDPNGNYLWVMSGGSNWTLSGRYDPDAETGDESAPGHRCADYAGSRGHYGFWSDDAFAERDYLHMGISVTDASDYEIEFVEIERTGFAGIRLLNPIEDGDHPMAGVRIHDNYVHDTAGEGIYFGWTGDPPSNLVPALEVYDNRFIRTGNEALQIQDIGGDTEIHHNVMGFGGLHWRDNGLGNYQDNNSQISTREGDIAIHDNVFIGAAGSLISFWSQPQMNDGDRSVTFSNNYIAEVRNLGVYFGGTAEAGSSFAFEGNWLRGLGFSYDDLDPAATPPGAAIQISPNIGGDVSLTDNRWEGSLMLFSGGMGPTESGNVNDSVEPIEFVNSGYPDGADVLALEIWTAASTLAPGSPPRTYAVGELVMYDAQLYECTAESTNEPPADHPESWMQLPLPVDDFRVVAGSTYDGIGIR